MLFDTNNITINELKDPLFTLKKVKLMVLRLDKIHPIVSGNKLFKLHYFLEQAIKIPNKSIVTFGGAYSNHLVATAYACKRLQLQCKGIVRGERPPVLSHTLKACLQYGMELEFVTRENYASMSQESESDNEKIIIPEGGYHPIGAKGASLIMDFLQLEKVSHICTAVGTATTLAGLILKANNDQRIIAVPVLKGFFDIPERLEYLTGKIDFPNLTILNEYHFGGYAKKSNDLLFLMNQLYEKFELPTDFVYTGKMMFGIWDQIKKDFFPEGSIIACIHTGGLQGNDSLPAGSLIF